MTKMTIFSFWTVVISFHAYAGNSILLTGENGSTTNNSANSVDASFSTANSKDSNEKKWTYELDFNAQEQTTPSSYSSTIIPGTKYNSAAFSTILYTTLDSLTVDINNPQGWLFGFAYAYSRQQGAGTPNTFSNSGMAEVGQKIDYGHKKQATDQDFDFAPSWRWKYSFTSGLIAADSYSVVRVNLQIYPQAANSISQNASELELTWDPKEWITLVGSYTQYSYGSSPNNFALLKSPKVGLPTSLNDYEAVGESIFHLGDHWDADFKETYSITATTDQTSTDEQTYTVTYLADDFEIGGGYDRQNPEGAPAIDSGIVTLRLNF